ncbi:flagellar biosynthetic protein FliR [Marivita sp. S6314]|uniref:flagellar biosynthetic protein FliR n=1 Tax=Marivita sp. S6314 TaxID=2926406 RepID=UPI001FF12638|nr:flagellar biosynthetic protein FliR [Marivita sp. S6314]MCK0151402.1 flagellar biosynthetic protein FliR [Marivita sp. S6314]
MIEGLTQDLNAQVWLMFAVFLRIAPAIALMPGYGEKSVSPQIKVMTSLFLAAAVAPILEPSLPPERLTGTALMQFTARETTIGVFLGLISRGMLFLLEKIGAVISQTVSLSQMLGNAIDPMPVISHVLTITGLALFFATSLNDEALFWLLSSYFVDIPYLQDIWGFFAETITGFFQYIMTNGVLLASGFIVLFVAYYLYSGFINKTMPQLMVTFIGIPLVSLLSIFFCTNIMS